MHVLVYLTSKILYEILGYVLFISLVASIISGTKISRTYFLNVSGWGVGPGRLYNKLLKLDSSGYGD